jgi:hypothetical protein
LPLVLSLNAIRAGCAAGLGVAGGSGHADFCLAGRLCGACRPHPLLADLWLAWCGVSP